MQIRGVGERLLWEKGWSSVWLQTPVQSNMNHRKVLCDKSGY